MGRDGVQSTDRSVLFLTDNRAGSAPLVEAMLEENISVSLFSRDTLPVDCTVGGEVDLCIVELERFTLEELSGCAGIRSCYSGLLALLIDDLDEMLQVMLYEQGVDELLVKPVNPLLMLARIRALFRRSEARRAGESLIFNELEINGGLRRVSFGDEEISFSAREFDLLWFMANRACRTLDREMLYRQVFGVEYNGYDRAVDMYVSRLRSRLGEYPGLGSLIKTVRGRGYLFAP